jgi:HD-GYP domain-containing protein (c-di-GMP phosphodiesterase class II)
VAPLAAAPAHAQYQPYTRQWERPDDDARRSPLDTARLTRGRDRAVGHAADPSCHDLLILQDCIVAVSSSRDLPELADRVQQAIQRLGAGVAVVFPWDRSAGALAAAVRHEHGESRTLAALRSGPLSAALLAGGRFWTAPDLDAEPRLDYVPARALGWRALAGVPLHAHGEPAGLLYVGWEAPHQVGERERTLLEILGQQLAVSVANANVLAESRARAEALVRAEQQTVQYARDLRRVYERERARRGEVQMAYLATVKVLAAAIETRDAYTGGHIERVAEYSVAIGRELGWDEDQLMTLELGALLHDVGKIGVDDGVLRKPAKLEPEEWEHMQRHPELGAHMLRDVPFLQASLSCVLHHHERYDGRGYPHRLAGEAIPLQARIVAVADTYDAMTSDRPYRKGLPVDTALAEITRCAGSQFDPHVVRAFLRVVETRPSISVSVA